MTMKSLYKVLVDGKSCHGGDLAWSLPTERDGEVIPGDWHTVEGMIAVCRNGLHFTAKPMNWVVAGCSVYLGEGRGKSAGEGDKSAYREGRLLRPAPEMLPLWWRGAMTFIRDEIPRVPWFRPDGDPDPAWRLFTAPTLGASRRAACSAAYGVARDAQRDAQRRAASDAAYDSAYSDAYGAASGAASDAARGAARGAAYDAAYDAVYDAAYDSAYVAAYGVARDASRDAPRGAARGAAYDAVRDAFRGAVLYVASEHICAGIPLDERYTAHARVRWDVWQKGYALLCDVDGVLYVYAREGVA